MASTLTKAKKLHVADVIIWKDESVAIIDIDTKADPKCVCTSA